MSWHVGPPREHTTVANATIFDWHQFLQHEVAETKARWRLDAYLVHVVAPVEIADTFLDEWLKELWREQTT